ncbi:hypothetical protein BBJ28_00015188, partial [Nothophytophthora sp. Chile5]
IPTVLTEFGCVTPAFPTVDGFEAQRTFHDAEFMNSRDYSDYFAGGFAFEYSTENANSMATSAYPFKTYGPQNYGLGYFSPEDCTDTGSSNCTYERFPNFESLAQAYSAYDGSSEPTLSDYKVPADHSEMSVCPVGSPVLSDFKWESDASQGEACPTPSETRFQCLNLATFAGNTPQTDAPPAVEPASLLAVTTQTLVAEMPTSSMTVTLPVNEPVSTVDSAPTPTSATTQPPTVPENTSIVTQVPASEQPVSMPTVTAQPPVVELSNPDGCRVGRSD